MNRLSVPKNLMWAGIVLIALVGLIHLVEAPEYFEEPTYLGILFVANVLGAGVAAVGIYRGERTWDWTLGAGVAGGAFIAYLISCSVGLPGLDEAEFAEPTGLAALVVEALYVGVYLKAITSGTTQPTGSPSTH
jgi:hypothetical protein